MLAGTGQERLSLIELHQLKWLLGSALALIGFWSLFQLSIGSVGLLYVFTIGLAVLLVFPHWAGKLSPSFWKATTPAVVVLLVIDFSLHYVEILEPMIRMVMILGFLRALQYRRRREDLQLLLLSLFMLVLTGVMTVSLMFAIQIVLFTPLAMGLLFIVNLLESSSQRELTAKDWEGFSWARFLVRIWKALDIRFLLFSAGMFACVVSVSSFIFVLIPRFRMGQNLSFMQIQTTGKKGFSDRIKFGDVNELSDDNSVAMRVEPPDRSLVPSIPYFRMIVLDEYRDGSFNLSVTARRTAIKEQMLSRYNSLFGNNVFLPNNAENDDNWIFYLEGDVSRFLPLLGSFDSVQFQKKTKFNAYPVLNLLELNQVTNKVFGYSVSGMTVGKDLQASQMEVRALRGLDPIVPELDDKGRVRNVDYPLTTLLLPPRASDREYLSKIVDEITHGEDVDLPSFTTRALEYLHQSYAYETSHAELQGEEEDPLMLWMRQAKTGWCEHFAGAYILLARTAGFPARAVAGFTGANWNDFENYLVVRNNNAHAWVEVFDARTNRWVLVDPTPRMMLGGNSLAGFAESSVRVETGWEAWVDSMRMVWYRRVVNFNQTDQVEIASGIRDLGQAFVEQVKQFVLGYWMAFKRWLASAWDIRKVMQVVAALAMFCLFVFAVRYVKSGLLLFLKVFGRLRGREWVEHNPDRRRAGRWLRKFQPHVGALQKGDSRESNRALMNAYEQLLALRYGESGSTTDSRQVFKNAKQALKRYQAM